MVALRWATRGIGIINTIALARLLAPRDFGIVAMAMLVVGGVETLSENGQRLALIRHAAPDRSHYDTVWTLSTLIGIALAGAIYAIAPLTVRYFHEPDATVVIKCLALCALLRGLENPGVADFRRNFNFQRDFLFGVMQKLGAFVIALTTALVVQNYWAIVAGILGSRSICLCLSYLMHPHRPRFDLSRVREIWSFSIWILADNVASYFVQKLDETVVGGMAGAGPMGRYSVASDIASSPIAEIASPATNAQFPVIAKLHNDPARAQEAFLGVLAAVATFSAALGTGVSLVAHDFIIVFLGRQWIDIAVLMPWIALEAVMFHCVNPASVFFQVTGNPQLTARMTWLRVGMLAIALPLASRSGTLEAVAAARFGVSLMLAPAVLLLLSGAYAIPVRRLIQRLWRPVAAAAIMAACVLLLQHKVEAWPVAARLVMCVVAGAALYVSALAVFWMLVGRPSGIESAVTNAILTRVRRPAHAAAVVVRSDPSLPPRE
jgi:O-antigen/teichoic acid export membrane protein